MDKQDRQDFGCLYRTVVDGQYRPSRVSGNPTVTCQGCGIIRQYRRDYRLRGKDGRYSRLPFAYHNRYPRPQ